MMKLPRKTALLTGTALLFLVVGAAASASWGSFSDGNKARSHDVISPHYSKNTHGLSYGTLPTRKQQAAHPGARISDSELPDLVGVVMDGGGTGYVYSSQLLAADEPASNPQEALENQESGGAHPTELTVYASDGVTVLGTFTIGAGDPTS
jgi:hypothetical protein